MWPFGGVDHNVGNQWTSLGTYSFSGGGNEYVQLNATVPGGSQYSADAMKFAPGSSSTVSIKNAHYYTYSVSEDIPYLIVLDGSIKYYRFTQNQDDVSGAGLIPTTTPPDDVKPRGRRWKRTNLHRGASEFCQLVFLLPASGIDGQSGHRQRH